MKMRPRQSGFSAIEALAALAIVAVALVPLVDLQSQIVRANAQQRAIRDEAVAQQNALALLRDVNPLATPQGSRQIGEETVMTWRAVPISELVRTTRAGQGDGEFNVRLFRLDVEIAGPRISTAFSVDQVGWQPLAPGRPEPLSPSR